MTKVGFLGLGIGSTMVERTGNAAIGTSLANVVEFETEV